MSFQVRYLDIIPYEDKFLIKDPLGISKEMLVNKESLLLLSLLNGRNSIEDIKTMFLRNTGIILSDSEILNFVQKMDKNYILYNDNFIKRMEFEKEKILSVSCKKIGFQFDFAKLKKEIEKCKALNEQNIKAIIVPHIDINIGLKTYTKAFSCIKDLNKKIFFIFGVPHSYAENYFSIFPKDYKIGENIIKIQKEIIEKIKNKIDFDIFSDVLAYKNEHSVEFPIIFLSLIKKDFYVIPSLVSKSDVPLLKNLAENIFEVIAPIKNEILLISSVDLSHVGRKFGDERSFNTEEIDRKYIECLKDMENERGFNFIESKNNFTRIDGLYTNFVFLEILKLMKAGKGEVLDYEMYCEDITDSIVSYASLIFK